MDGTKKYFYNNITQTNDLTGTNIIATKDISGSTVLGQPGTYFTGITSNIQTQLNQLTYDIISTGQTSSGNIILYVNTYVQPQINSLSGNVYLLNDQYISLSGLVNRVYNYIPYYSTTFIQPQIDTISSIVSLHTNQIITLSSTINTISNYIPYYSNTFLQPQINTISSIVYLHTNQLRTLSGVINTIGNYIVTYCINYRR